MRSFHPLPGMDVVVDGVRVHAVTHGPAGGLPVLLVHGLPTSSYLWRDVMRDLEHVHPTIAPDLLGLGRSERPPHCQLGLPAQAALLLRLLDELGHPRVAVAGHDIGGAVAVHMAALAPDRVAALILVASPLHADVWPTAAALPLLAPIAGEAYIAGLRRVPALARSVLASVLGGRTPPRELSHYLAPLLTADGARGLLRLTRAVDLPAVEAAWRIVRADPPPTLVLWGENDRVHQLPYGRRVCSELPGAVWVPVTDAGHLLPQERPERLAEEVGAFLADLQPAHLST